MFIVVSYDIPDDRRRTKVMKALKDLQPKMEELKNAVFPDVFVVDYVKVYKKK